MIRLGEPDDPVAPERETAEVPPADALLAELGPDRARTVLAEQDELVHTAPECLLLIQGGPGTGKTITALRRVAALLDDSDLELTAADVLVVGPSPAFTRRSRAVLDGWGHPGVTHRSIAGLLPAVEGGRPEPPYVTRLKGEARMAGLLGRALADRPAALAGDLPTSIMVGGRDVLLDPAALQRVIATAKASEAPPDDRRRILRAVLAAASSDPRRVLLAADLLAERLWPEFDARTFLIGLFGSRERLTEAAGGEFTDREITALCRESADAALSDADLALLDEVEHLAGDQPAQYRHVVVDEAQDLSPMQLRAVSRRSANGSLTVVGDMAQSTGPWARDDWHDVLAHLPAETPHVHRELRFGYRVPRQIFELAAELLPTAAPSVQAPTTVREGPADPVLTPVGPADRAASVVAAAVEHAAAGRSVAIVCPGRCRDEVEALLRAEDVPWRTPGAGHEGPALTLLGPHEAKGLEFDAAIVVEPGLIVDDDPRGHRLLYIALTRATAYLHLVGAREDLPIDYPAPEPPAPVAPAPEPPPAPAGPELDPAVRESIDVVAHALAETLLANLTPELWPVALDRLIELINPDG